MAEKTKPKVAASMLPALPSSDQEGDVQLGVHGGAVVLENGGHVSGGFFFEKVFGVPQSPLTGPMCNHYME
jgi:hypothetical protein